MAIVTRAGLGRELTYAEVDSNLSELDSRTAVRWQNPQLTENGWAAPDNAEQWMGPCDEQI